MSIYYPYLKVKKSYFFIIILIIVYLKAYFYIFLDTFCFNSDTFATQSGSAVIKQAVAKYFVTAF